MRRSYSKFNELLLFLTSGSNISCIIPRLKRMKFFHSNFYFKNHFF